MVKDEEIKRAVSRILQRSERQEDLQKLLGTFVDVGVLPQLDNRNNQVFYGRRGTGKTHVLKVLASRLSEDATNAVVYIDARTLGSTAQFSDATVPLSRRCLSLFRDVLSEIYNALLEFVVEHDRAHALEELDTLLHVVTQSHDRVEPQAVEVRRGTGAAEGRSVGAQVSPSGPSLKVEWSSKRESVSGTTESYSVSVEDKLVFPGLYGQLNKVLDAANANLFILFDEWSSLPSDVQPYLAEFLKRGVLPVQRATLKVASLEYRSHFVLFADEQEYGFQLGADVAVTQDLDDYYVFDRNPSQITAAYAEVLYRHLSSELPDGYLGENHRVRSGSDLSSRMFTEHATFAELARASEGVIRDLINIFTSAYFNALRRDRESIDRKAISEAARQWFEQDKARYLDDDLHKVLRRIVDEVIGNRRARSFLLPRELERHPVVQRLFDARVLHQMQRGYADKDNPGVRYNIYSLDFGTYVDLLGTSKQPETALTESTDDEQTDDEQTDDEQTDDEQVVVPFDDKRSIRRIVLAESDLVLQINGQTSN